MPKKRAPEGALFVRLPALAVEKLDRAAEALGMRKKDLVAGLVTRYVDPDSQRGLSALGALSTPKVTVEQYVAYAKQVQDSLGETAEILQGMNLVAFSDMRTRTFYIFTTKDHPAHPAWITRQMDEEGGQVHVRQIGYFAGSEAEFAKLFRYYQERNVQLQEEVERRNQ